MIEKILNKFRYWKDTFKSKKYYETFKNNNIKFISDEEVVNRILDGCNLSRFGDGEFKWILGAKQNNFQKQDEKMQEKLKKVLTEDNSNLIIGITKSFIDVSDYNKQAKKYWKLFYYRYGKQLLPLLKKSEYANASITRFYMDYENKDDALLRLKNIKRIWDNLDIIIVEGDKTLMGVNNDLFDNAKSVKRIIVPSVNAFDKYELIYDSIKKQSKDVLYLLAIGPTATILASDLSKIGYHAVDIGHLDIEYEWALAGAKKKKKVEGKYVNEAGGINKKGLNCPDEYLKSIIDKIE